MNKQTQKELLNLVKKNYSEIAEQFSETRNKALWPELIKFTEEIKEGEKILDVGCGNGRLFEVLQDKKIEYLGVDNSKELIKLAAQKFAKGKFVEGDILELSKLPEINFDYVFCIAVLQHIPSEQLQIDAMKQLRNKVNEKGKIIISVWNMWAKEKLRRNILKYLLLKIIGKNKMDFGDILFDWKNSEGEVVSKRYYHAFRKNELKRIFKKAGFKIDKLYKDKHNYYAVLQK